MQLRKGEHPVMCWRSSNATASAVKLAPSMMCADFRCLEDVVHKLEDAGVDWLHFDVMDGCFVPNITFGPLVIEALRPVTQLPFDVHLMIANPERYVDAFAKAGADYITVHIEALEHPERVIERIRELGVKTAIAVSPPTPLTRVEPLLAHLDMVLIMSVNPGFAGQKFMPEVVPKIECIASLKHRNGWSLELEVDGGMSLQTAPIVVRAGATVIVGGASSIFVRDKSFQEAVHDMRSAIAVALTSKGV